MLIVGGAILGLILGLLLGITLGAGIVVNRIREFRDMLPDPHAHPAFETSTSREIVDNVLDYLLRR